MAKPLLITAGEPAGIGPDLCLRLAAEAPAQSFVVVADPVALKDRADKLGVTVSLTLYESGTTLQDGLNVLPFELADPSVCGTPSTCNAEPLLQSLRDAAERCLNGEFSALVTGPLQKSVFNDAGIPFTGHTEFLADVAGTDAPVMLLVAGDLRVALVSTHLPLRQVPDYITTERIITIARIVHDGLAQQFAITDPEIVVCGLNPHAGEGGHLGHEDDEIIAPAVAALQRDGIRTRGPLPADTAFTPAAGHADAIIAMYHDQGLPVLKHAGFGHAVNVTLGIPFVRTSVDHGTALDIAGTGMADSGSLRAAIAIAAKMAAQ